MQLKTRLTGKAATISFSRLRLSATTTFCLKMGACLTAAQLKTSTSVVIRMISTRTLQRVLISRLGLGAQLLSVPPVESRREELPIRLTSWAQKCKRSKTHSVAPLNAPLNRLVSHISVQSTSVEPTKRSYKPRRKHSKGKKRCGLDEKCKGPPKTFTNSYLMSRQLCLCIKHTTLSVCRLRPKSLLIRACLMGSL